MLVGERESQIGTNHVTKGRERVEDAKGNFADFHVGLFLVIFSGRIEFILRGHSSRNVATYWRW